MDKFVYYIEMQANPTYYAVQLYAHYTMIKATATASEYTKPSDLWIFLTTNACPQVIIPSTNTFNNLIGFNAGNYPVVSA